MADFIPDAAVTEWRALAAALETAETPCQTTDPEAWFPERGESPDRARELCDICPVVAECRAYGLAAREPAGVWGGLTLADRQRIWRENN